VAAGVRAEHIDGTTPKDERDNILARLASGDLTVVTNAMVLTEGWDLPITSCCVLARPTKNMGLFRQMIGRVLRPAEGKTNAIILDHAGAVHNHGLPEDRVEWTLDPDNRASAPEHEKRQSDREMKLIECSECGALRKGGLPCPSCGFLPKRPKAFVPFIDGDLVEVGRSPNRATAEDRQDFYAQLLHIANERGYKPGWAFYKTKEKFGIGPHGSQAPLPPTPEVLAWVRSRNIAWAKSRNNPNNGGGIFAQTMRRAGGTI
jgi:superfamily II DNA or RNA helicase